MPRLLASFTLLATLLTALAAPALAAPPTGGEDLFVVYADGAEGYMDKTGELVILPAYELAQVFHEGLAAAFTPGQRKAGFLDPSGKWAIEPKFDFVKAFSDGRAAAKDPETHNWGYLDAKGKWAIPARYERAMPFADQRATVELPGRKGAVIDPSGAVVFRLPPEADIGDPPGFSEGLMCIDLKDTIRVVDRTGNTVFQGQWKHCRDFSEGLMAARDEDDWSYLDKTGKVVLEGYDFAWGFSEGLAAVKPKGEEKFGYIDTTGALVIPPQFDDAYAFSEGRAAVGINGRLAYIDTTGKVVIEPKWISPESSAERFRRGLAMVGVRDPKGQLMRGYIDRNGKVVRAPSR